MIDPDYLVTDFSAAASLARVDGWPCPIRTDSHPAPHTPPPLPPEHAAVYVFALTDRYGASCPAGAGRVLKVGRVGARSAPRFTYQHYGLSAPSTLARSLLKYRVLWPWLGIDELTDSDVKPWMLANLDRYHFFVPGGRDYVCASLEMYIRARVGSVFEGAA